MLKVHPKYTCNKLQGQKEASNHSKGIDCAFLLGLKVLFHFKFDGLGFDVERVEVFVEVDNVVPDVPEVLDNIG